jgi:hypothetical protein
VELRRTYFRCFGCRDSGFCADDVLGLADGTSGPARRLIVLAAGSWAFERAAENLAEFCGLVVSGSTIRRLAYAESPALERTAESAAACEPFRRAAGEVEFQTDGAMVNTTAGWTEMKLGLFLKREPGEAATLDDWDRRTLPDATAKLVFAAAEPIEQFQTRWRPWARRVGLTDWSGLVVKGDGAEWIWNAADAQFPGAAQLLDALHGLEHVGAASRALHGEGTDASRQWFQATRRRLLGDGWWGLCDAVQQTLSAGDAPAIRTVLDPMLAYFAKHHTRLNYFERIRSGRSIGTGAAEGAAKNVIGRRLKANNARWRLENVNKMASICSVVQTRAPAWSLHWDPPTAEAPPKV